MITGYLSSVSSVSTDNFSLQISKSLVSISLHRYMSFSSSFIKDSSRSFFYIISSKKYFKFGQPNLMTYVNSS